MDCHSDPDTAMIIEGLYIFPDDPDPDELNEAHVFLRRSYLCQDQ